jgi:hemolysin activation/secretion protein
MNNMKSHLHLKPLIAVLFALLPFVAQAAPDAGSILQQIKPSSPPLPSSSATGLIIKGANGEKLPTSIPFMVKSITISGNTLFDNATLHSLVANAEGKNATLQQIDELTARITDYYHAHGYPLARAYIPAQSIIDGIVKIEVIEARYDKIRLDNSSHVKDAWLNTTLAPLQSGAPVEQKVLDGSLLRLSDIPGVIVNATLQPGKATGTSDLNIQASASASVTGNIALDNNGNRYTGRARAGATVNFVNPLQHGDVLSLNGLSSGSGMNYGRLSYETLLNGNGTRLGGAFSALHYILGDTLTSLDGHGTAQVGSVWVKHPLIRSRRVNVYAQVQYDNKRLKDHLDTNGSHTDRTLSNWTASLSSDVQDTLLSGGMNTWSLGLTKGQVGFDNAAAQLSDAATAATQGNFSKLNANLARLQSVNANNALYLSFSAQWTNTNLDSAEKMVAGGPYTVRAYDIGVLSGDSGYQGTAELRHDMGSIWQGQWQAVAFVDSEHVTVNKNTWTTGVNGATLSGAGIGLNWFRQNNWSGKAYLAAPLGSTPVLLSTRSSARAWVQLSKGL